MSDSFKTPWTVAHQALLSMGFRRQEYWSSLPFFFLGDLPHVGIEPESLEASSALQADFLTVEPPGKPFQVDVTKFSDLFRQYIIWTHLKINPINTSITSFPVIL